MNPSTVTVDQLSSIVNQAATDPAFRAELLANPSATLQNAGIAIPAGATVKVVEETQSLRYAIVSARPDDISDADLATATSESITNDGSVAGNIAAYAQLVAKSWTDSSLRSSLLSDPAATLSAHGISVPSGVQVKAIESSSNDLVVAAPPAAATSDSSLNFAYIAQQVNDNFTNLTKLITAGSYIAGLGFSVGAITKFKQHKDNPTQIPIGTPIALVFIGAALLFLPTILSTAGTTMFGGGGGTVAGPTGTVFT
jgi:intracellular multiplication protein IcmD